MTLTNAREYRRNNQIWAIQRNGSNRGLKTNKIKTRPMLMRITECQFMLTQTCSSLISSLTSGGKDTLLYLIKSLSSFYICLLTFLGGNLRIITITEMFFYSTVYVRVMLSSSTFSLTSFVQQSNNTLLNDYRSREIEHLTACVFRL